MRQEDQTTFTMESTVIKSIKALMHAFFPFIHFFGKNNSTGFTGPELVGKPETTAVPESCFLRLKIAAVHIFMLRKSYFG